VSSSFDDFRVAFSGLSAGWITITLRAGAQEINESFAHVYPTLENLCAALCDLGEGRSARAVVFLLEPEELELRVSSVETDTVSVTVARHRDHRRDGARRATIVLEFTGATHDVILSVGSHDLSTAAGRVSHELSPLAA
jgi:hypothetical protein